MIWQKRLAVGIIVLYTLLAVPAAFGAYKFLQNTSLNFKPNDKSMVGRTEALALRSFNRGQIFPQPVLLLCTNHNRSESIVGNPLFAAFAGALRAAVQAPDSPLFGIITPYMQDYYSIPPYAAAFRSHVLGGPNNDTTVIQLEISNGMDLDRATSAVANFYQNWTAAMRATFDVQSTSVPQIYKDCEEGVITDLLKVDAVSVPISILVMVICVGTARMLIVPAMTVPLGILFCFGLLYPVSVVLPMSSLAPEMAAAVMVAISIDYSLFLASRFRDEARRYHAAGDDSESARVQVVWRTTVLTAHNVCVSGVTIAMALAGVAILPATFLSAIGVAFVFGALLSVVVSMTLVPAVFLLFFPFFARPPLTFRETLQEAKNNFRRIGARFGCCCISRDHTDVDIHVAEDSLLGGESKTRFELNNADLRALGTHPYVNDSGAGRSTSSPYARMDRSTLVYDAYLEKQLDVQCASPWFRVGLWSVRHPFVVIFCVLAAGAPFFYLASQLKVDFVLQNQVPRDAEHVLLLTRMQKEIGHGNAFPFYVVLEANQTGALFSPAFFDATNAFISRVVGSAIGGQIANVMTFTRQPSNSGALIPFWEAQAAMSLPAGWNSDADAYKFLFNKTVDATNTVGLVALTCTFDPFSYEALHFLNVLDTTISDFQHDFSETVRFIGVTGASSDGWQLMTDVMRRFPIQIGVTFGAIFVFIACVFRSVFVPLRMVVTVAYTVAVAFGAGVLVFQYGWLHPVWPAMEGVVAFSWTVPIFCFSLLCALALDYDIFLLTRVVEMKRLGFRDDAAVVKAVYHTGRVISYAGVIMAIALGSLTFANVTMLNQNAVVSFVAVLVDAFVVRPLLVPALMSVAPRVVWWPRRFGVCERDLDDMDY